MPSQKHLVSSAELYHEGHCRPDLGSGQSTFSPGCHQVVLNWWHYHEEVLANITLNILLYSWRYLITFSPVTYWLTSIDHHNSHLHNNMVGPETDSASVLSITYHIIILICSLSFSPSISQSVSLSLSLTHTRTGSTGQHYMNVNFDICRLKCTSGQIFWFDISIYLRF